MAIKNSHILRDTKGTYEVFNILRVEDFMGTLRFLGLGPRGEPTVGRFLNPFYQSEVEIYSNNRLILMHVFRRADPFPRYSF